MTKTKLKIVFGYDTVDQGGVRPTPRTKCTIFDADNVLSEASVLLHFRDAANRIVARKCAFEKAVNPDTIANVELRRTLWKQFRESMVQPDIWRAKPYDFMDTLTNLHCISNDQKLALAQQFNSYLEENCAVAEDAPHPIGEAINLHAEPAHPIHEQILEEAG